MSELVLPTETGPTIIARKIEARIPPYPTPVGPT
jgi:hypothetical protein